jgi:hypothetical protein
MPLQQRFGDAGLAVREHGAARPGKDLDLLGEEGGEVGESGAGGGEVGEQARHQLEIFPALRLEYVGVMLTDLILPGLYRKNQCCGSGMFIPDPDFYPSRIPDPKTTTEEKGETKFVCTQIPQNWVNFQRTIELFTQNNCH